METFKINAGFERIGFFILFELFFLHIISCFWVLVHTYKEENNWLTIRTDALLGEGEVITTNLQKYFIAFFYITETITTVGYGEMIATNILERVLMVVLMLAGVCVFSVIAGSLSSLISNIDNVEANLNEKLMKLNKLRDQFSFSDELF